MRRVAIDGWLRLFSISPFGECAKDGAPDYFWLVEIDETKVGYPPSKFCAMTCSREWT